MTKQTNGWMTPVPRQSLSRTVVEKIKEGLLSGEIIPGEYLPSESELAERLGVGKSSVREAIKMLEAMGVVEVCKGNGSRVRTSVDSSIMNPLVIQLILQSKTESKQKLVEFRKMIETSGGMLAIDNASDEDIQRLEKVHEKTKLDFKKGKISVSNDMEFHNTIYECTHNSFVVCIGKSTLELCLPSLFAANRDYSRNVTRDHDRILDAIKRRDKAAYAEAVEQSLATWEKLVLNEE